MVDGTVAVPQAPGIGVEIDRILRSATIPTSLRRLLALSALLNWIGAANIVASNQLML